MARNPSTKSKGGSFTEEEIDAVFSKATAFNNSYLKDFRLDKCGAIIKRSDYGNRNSKFGWEIDHIVPVSNNGSDDLNNLQPLHWENNVAKSDYPDSKWTCAVK